LLEKFKKVIAEKNKLIQKMHQTIEQLSNKEVSA
jgi:hypothetical protein